MGKKKSKGKKKKTTTKKKSRKKKTTKRKSTRKKVVRAGAPESADPEVRFWNLYGATMRGLDEARNNLRERLLADPRPPQSERSSIRISLRRIEFEWELVYQQGLGFAARSVAVEPPSAQQVTQARQIADRLDELAVDADSVPIVMGAVTDLMTIWGESNPSA